MEPNVLRGLVTAALDEHGTKALLGLPDDEFDCCVEEVVKVLGLWIDDVIDELRDEALIRFASHGPRDRRGAAFWDVANWLNESQEIPRG